MRHFENEYTKEISFPIGGIGTGSIGLGGNGRFMDWEIFNRPAKGSVNGYSHFAVRVKDKNGKIKAKIISSPEKFKAETKSEARTGVNVLTRTALTVIAKTVIINFAND